MRPKTRAALESIQEAITFIHEDTAALSYDRFMRNRRARQLVEVNFVHIGEALARLRREDPLVLDQLSEYQSIIAFRNILVHNYDTLDFSRVWIVIQRYLPKLEQETSLLLLEPESPDDTEPPN